MRYTIRHETRCRFDSPVGYSIRNLRLTPREDGGQHVESWHVDAPSRCARSVDAWGNTTHQLTLTEPHEEVRIVVTGVVEVSDETPPLPSDTNGVAPLAFLAPSHLTDVSPALEEFARRHLLGQGKSAPNIDRLLACIHAINAKVLLAPTGGQAVRGAAATFERGYGALHDQVHVFIAACRLAGLPARFVSGLHVGDSTTEYAWADVWLPAQASWTSFDVRRARQVDGHFVRLAVGRDYLDACPMRASHLGNVEEEVRVIVQAH